MKNISFTSEAKTRPICLMSEENLRLSLASPLDSDFRFQSTSKITRCKQNFADENYSTRKKSFEKLWIKSCCIFFILNEMSLIFQNHFEFNFDFAIKYQRSVHERPWTCEHLRTVQLFGINKDSKFSWIFHNILNSSNWLFFRRFSCCENA